MKVIVDFSVVPIGVGVSVSKYVAACQRVLDEMNLKTNLHAYGTNVEGEWDEVFSAIKRCHEAVHGMGAPRISTVIKVGTRIDRDQTMSDKVTSVESKLEG
ncbi:MAG: MTH1187 family thiamine-binding protein, partial [Planctomycetota bacterium]